jgi:hypothetical protein
MARRRRRTVYIGDQRWKLERTRLRSDAGQCDYTAKVIRLCSSLSGLDLLDTLIHELTHARWPDLSEDAVEEFATTLAGVIDAEGFRHGEDEEAD